MNIFKWLKSKTGKLPITVAQAAGITAVVGAAGFAALNFLSGSSDTNNTFIPPSAYEQGNVVYVAQGPASYDPDGAAGSTFKAAPSRSIQLANQQEAQLRQAQELEGFSAQPTFEEPAPISGVEGKAYELSGGEKGLGMGGNKQIGNSFEILKNMPAQLNGLGDVIAQAQTAAAGGTMPGGAAAPAAGGANTPAANAGATSGEGGSQGPTLARATLGGGSGLPRAGGSSSGGSNMFVVQDSKKNKGSSQQASEAEAMAQAGNAIEQARAAMTRMREGETLKARSNFGPSDGLSGSRDATIRKSRNFGGKGGNELAMIRKQSAAISANRTNTANAGAMPFMSGEKISGGLVVSQDNVVIGQSATSGDLGGRSTSRAQMRGVQSKLDQVQSNMDERKAARDDLKSWLFQMATAAIPAIVAIAALVAVWKKAGWASPWGCVAFGLAVVLTAVTLLFILRGTSRHVEAYKLVNGNDWWTAGAWGLAGLLTGGTAAAWVLPVLGVIPKFLDAGWAAVGGIFGLFGPGKGLLDDIGHLKDQEYYHEPESDEAHQTADEEQ